MSAPAFGGLIHGRHLAHQAHALTQSRRCADGLVRIRHEANALGLLITLCPDPTCDGCRANRCAQEHLDQLGYSAVVAVSLN